MFIKSKKYRPFSLGEGMRGMRPDATPMKLNNYSTPCFKKINHQFQITK